MPQVTHKSSSSSIEKQPVVRTVECRKPHTSHLGMPSKHSKGTKSHSTLAQLPGANLNHHHLLKANLQQMAKQRWATKAACNGNLRQKWNEWSPNHELR